MKLLHSGRYLYDVVVNGLFHLQGSAKELQLQLDVPGQYHDVNRALNQLLADDSLSDDEERLLTASLFFSMLPLHRSEPCHCVVFSCIGLLILEQRFADVLRAAGR